MVRIALLSTLTAALVAAPLTSPRAEGLGDRPLHEEATALLVKLLDLEADALAMERIPVILCATLRREMPPMRDRLLRLGKTLAGAAAGPGAYDIARTRAARDVVEAAEHFQASELEISRLLRQPSETRLARVRQWRENVAALIFYLDLKEMEP